MKCQSLLLPGGCCYNLYYRFKNKFYNAYNINFTQICILYIYIYGHRYNSNLWAFVEDLLIYNPMAANHLL